MDNIDGAKNRLQEYCQQRCMPLPIYYTLEKAGPDHSPLFQVRLDVWRIISVIIFLGIQVEVIVDGMAFTGEWASRKRDAEKFAAMEALININKPPSPPKAVINHETKDPCDFFEKLNLTTEEQENESMECD